MVVIEFSLWTGQLKVALAAVTTLKPHRLMLVATAGLFTCRVQSSKVEPIWHEQCRRCRPPKRPFMAPLAAKFHRDA